MINLINFYLATEDQVLSRRPTLTKKSIRTPSFIVKSDETELETCYFTVLGMTCASCVDSIQRNLSKVEGTVNRFIVT